MRATNTASELGPHTQTNRGTCPSVSVLGSEFTTKPLYYRKYIRIRARPLCSGPVISRARVLVHEVLGRGAQALVRGGARCASPRPMPTAPHRCWIVVPRPVPAAAHRYLIVVPRQIPAAPLVVNRMYLIDALGRCPRRRSLCVTGT